MSGLANRRAYSTEKIELLRAELNEAVQFAAGRACVYATGSLGRGEASEFSDLDVFIAGKSKRNDEGQFSEDRELSHLNEICIQAELIKASRRLHYKEFSRDGRYLDHHSVHEFVNVLGTEQDDVTNTVGCLPAILRSYIYWQSFVQQYCFSRRCSQNDTVDANPST